MQEKEVQMPLVSIIVPVYNVEQYLSECVDSVLAQTYTNLEVILVDDGSPDNCGNICEQYKNSDIRVKVIHKENGGLSEARNFGLEVCKGDLIAFIDSDDYISPCFVETMVHAMIKNECQVAALVSSKPFCDGDIVGLDLDPSFCKISKCSAQEGLKMMLYQNIATGAPFKICQREVFYNIRFPKGYLYEDVATTYKEFFQAKEVCLIEGKLYAYRKRKDSITHQSFSRKKLISIKIHDQLVSDRNILDNGLLDAATARVYQMVFNVFLQVPFHDKKTMKLLWKYIVKDRKTILHDKSPFMSKKNKIGAMVSYFGMNVTHLIGNKVLHH